MTIKNIPTAELAEIIAGLVQKGLTFECTPQPGMPDGYWKIELTGGY